jgi:hypothetical protein
MIKERSLDALSGTGFVVVSVSDKRESDCLARWMVQPLAHRLFPVSQDKSRRGCLEGWARLGRAVCDSSSFPLEWVGIDLLFRTVRRRIGSVGLVWCCAVLCTKGG